MLDLSAIAKLLEGGNTMTVVFGILWILDEVLGSIPSVKANNVYSIITAILAAVKDQVVPAKPAATPAAPSSTPTAQ